MLSDMIPARRCLGADVSNHRPRDAVFGRQFVEQAPAPWGGSYRQNICFCKFGIGRFRTVLSMTAAMRNHVSHIFSACGPSQIIRPIVCAATIAMSNVSFACRRRAMKRFANKSVNLAGLSLAVNAKANQMIAPSTPNVRGQNPASVCAKSIGCPADAPIVRNFIIGRNRDCPPFFIRVIKVIHSEVTFRCGQGRALLTQRYRPVFHNRITFCSQTLIAAGWAE